MNGAPRLVVKQIDLGVRPVRLRLPFRFGAVTLHQCPQLFVRAVVEVEGRGSATGFAAEMMVPKWFDKRAGFSHGNNIAHLADSTRRAADAYLNDATSSAFGLFSRHYTALMSAGARAGATELTSAYGQAVIDRAVLDGLCRALNLSFFDAMAKNLVGLEDDGLIADLNGFAWDDWLPTLAPLHRIEARHTIGMLDELHTTRNDANGLPTTLPAAISCYGLRVFKIKLGGDVDADASRLADVLDVLDAHAPGHRYTLDGNEQYRDPMQLDALFERIRALPAFARRPDALLYVEQPLPRELSLQHPVRSAKAIAPLLMDEADGTLSAFVRGAELGWQGVSSKACKGLYKSLVNRARCSVWNAAERRQAGPASFFMSAEDLTCQAGLSVQQDLALLSLLGLAHSERNGHHYVDGFGEGSSSAAVSSAAVSSQVSTSEALASEARAFASAHPDLYESSSGAPRLRIERGAIRIDSLFAPGYGHRADPDWTAMRPLADAAAMG